MTSQAMQTAVIRFTIPRDQIQTVMHAAISEVLCVVGEQGIGPAGPVYSYHFRMDPDVFDFEVGVPVSKPVISTGRVIPSELPAKRVVRTIYHGPYEGLGSAWGEFEEWISVNGHAAAPDLWEFYVTGPESGPDPVTWRTELNRPLN
jgi:effector-binding domain-containing protein